MIEGTTEGKEGNRVFSLSSSLQATDVNAKAITFTQVMKNMTLISLLLLPFLLYWLLILFFLTSHVFFLRYFFFLFSSYFPHLQHFFPASLCPSRPVSEMSTCKTFPLFFPSSVSPCFKRRVTTYPGLRLWTSAPFCPLILHLRWCVGRSRNTWRKRTNCLFCSC